MKRFFFLCFISLWLTACGAPLVDPSLVLGTPAGPSSPQAIVQSGESVTAVTAMPSPMRTATPDRYADLHATQTAISLSQVQLDQAEKELKLQLMRDSATSTAGAQATSTAVAAAIGTSAVSTQIAQTQMGYALQVAGTQTAIPLTQTALQATQQVEQIQLSVSKVQAVLWPILLVLVFIAFAVLGWLWLRKHIETRFLQNSQIRPDEKGRFSAVPEDAIPGKSKRMVNLNLQVRAVHDPAIPDDLTPEQALTNAHDQRHLEAVRSLSESNVLARAASKLLSNNGQPGEPGVNIQPLPQSDNLLQALELPDWRLLNRWDGQLLPYGADGSKLLTVDPAKRPHLMVTGTTGTGKTRYEIRTIVAGALTSGWQVVVIGKQVDYIPFEDHANVTLIPANASREPEKYIQILHSACDQMFARDEFLVSHKVSTWDRYGGPQTLIVVDDYTAAMLQMPRSSQSEVMRWLLAIAMDGRKYGLNLLLGLQRATWTCISTDLRSQMARITLRLGSAHESRIVLDENGAELLPDRHFLARLEDGSGLIHGAAFALDDAQTFTFLQSRPVQAIGPVDWIDAEATASLPMVDEEITMDRRIREVLLRMKAEDKVNISQAQREIYGEEDDRGGKHWKKIQQIWIEMQTKDATATARGDGFEPLPGNATGIAAGNAA